MHVAKLAPRFTTFLLGHAEKSKLWDKLGVSIFSITIMVAHKRSWEPHICTCICASTTRESGPHLSAFSFFFHLSFFSFSYLFSGVIDLLLGLFPIQTFLRKHHGDDGVPKCAGRHREFCCEFFTQISEPLCAYFRLNWADQYCLGIIGKIFSAHRTWV